MADTGLYGHWETEVSLLYIGACSSSLIALYVGQNDYVQRFTDRSSQRRQSKNIFRRQLAFAFVTDLLDAGLGLCRLQIRATFTCIA